MGWSTGAKKNAEFPAVQLLLCLISDTAAARARPEILLRIRILLYELLRQVYGGKTLTISPYIS